jgi:hypothetical protein
VTDFFEWHGAGTIATQPPLGAMWKADRVFTAIRFGWSLDQFAIRFDPDETTVNKPGREVAIVMQGPQTTMCLIFPLLYQKIGDFLLSQQTAPDTWQEISRHQTISSQSIIELSVPWKDLQLRPGEIAHLSIIVREHGLEVTRYPSPKPAVLTVPGPDFEAELWSV